MASFTRKFAAGRLWLLAGILLAACVTLPYSYSPPLSTFEEPKVREPDLKAIPVRLAAQEGLRELEIMGTTAGTMRLVSSGSRVANRGRLMPLEARVRPANGQRLTIGKRTYAGELLVESHPQTGLHVTNLIDLEDYIRGVVAGESVLWSAKPTELEVQAICARSYAVATLRERLTTDADAFLWDDTRDQVYVGSTLVATGSRGEELERKLANAIAVTRGQVLGLRAQVLDARFHAACGGTTASFRDIFGHDSVAAAIPSVPCPPCAQAKAAGANADASASNVWSFTASPTELSRLARSLKLGSSVQSLRPTRTDAYGRWLEVELCGDEQRLTVSSKDMRLAIGATRMGSGQIERMWPAPGAALDGGLFLEGRGRGHGVGLCQVGSRALANQGWSSTRILTHYYPGAQLGKVDSSGRFHASSAFNETE